MSTYKMAGKNLKLVSKKTALEQYDRGKLICCRMAKQDYVFTKAYNNEEQDRIKFDQVRGQWYAE